MLKLQNLKENEKLLVAVRRHWVIYLVVFIYFLVWLCISMVSLILSDFSSGIMIMNIIMWLIYSIFLYLEWLNHELDLFLVTNNRIIWVEQISFLNRTVSECNLGQVQEVNSMTKGLFANLLNYWTLTIQTAWASATLKMDYAPDSMQEARKILNIVDDYRDAQVRAMSENPELVK